MKLCRPAYVSPIPILTLSHSGRRPPGPAFSGMGSPGAGRPLSVSGPPGYMTSDGPAWPPGAGWPTTDSSPNVVKSRDIGASLAKVADRL